MWTNESIIRQNLVQPHVLRKMVHYGLGPVAEWLNFQVLRFSRLGWWVPIPGIDLLHSPTTLCRCLTCKKIEEDWQQMLVQGESYSQRKIVWLTGVCLSHEWQGWLGIRKPTMRFNTWIKEKRKKHICISIKAGIILKFMSYLWFFGDVITLHSFSSTK